MKEYVLRDYQQTAADLTYTDAMTKGIHPVCVLPTGSGKSVVLCEIVDKILTEDPEWNVLILSHTEEICEQDHTTLTDYFGGIDIGLYHAGLGSRTIMKITVAGIQSASRQRDKFNRFDFVIIDEAHSVPTAGEGQYRTFLKGFDTYIGLTATHFRLGHGYIHKGEGTIFNKISIDYSSGAKFVGLVDEGYISKIYTKQTLLELNANDIRTRLGDFVIPDMAKKFNREEITNQAVKEIVEIGENYYKWLIFSIDIDHAEAITEQLISHGIKAIAIHSKMENRKKAVSDIRRNKYQAVVNVDILTTGFDDPNIDLIALMRPTKSPVLHVQSIGRGLRVARKKDHCLVLDFAGNTERLGPINDINLEIARQTSGKGPTIMKTCPDCMCLVPIATRTCPACGSEFEIEKGKDLQNTSGFKSVVSKERREREEGEEFHHWVDIRSVTYSLWSKAGKPPSMLVEYHPSTGGKHYREWVLLNHKGWAQRNAEKWVMRRWTGSGIPQPRTAIDAINKRKYFKTPKAIKIDFNNKFQKIVEHRF